MLDRKLELTERFRLSEPLKKQGNQGTVWIGMDRQDPASPSTIAIKLYAPGAVDSEEDRAQFEREARILEEIRHPSIVRYIAHGKADREGGTYFGYSFIVLEYLENFCTLAEWANESGPGCDWRLSARIVADIANALHEVQKRGFLHRDVSAKNVMVRQSGEDVTTKLIDFGLVRPVRGTSNATKTADDAGTRAFMSPEAWDGKLSRLTDKSDVWGCGVVLYVLLTGQLPFGDERQTLVELHRRIERERLCWPAGFDSQCPQPLLTIIKQCLEKQPGMRFTATQLEEHLSGVLSQENKYAVPRPPFWIWMNARCLESRREISSSLAIIFILTVIIWGSLSQSRAKESDAHAQREKMARIKQEHLTGEQIVAAEERDLTARRNGYSAALKLCQEALDVGDYARVIELLDSQQAPPGKVDLRGFEWHWLWHVCHRDWQSFGPHGASSRCVAWASDGYTVASGGNNSRVQLWDAKTQRLLADLKGHDRDAVLAISFSADGRLLATSGEDGTARLWDVPARKLRATFQGPGQRLGAVALSPDGRILATGLQDDFSPHSVLIWDVDTKSQVILDGLDLPVHSLAFSPNGRTLAVGTGPCVAFDTPCELLLYKFDESWTKGEAPASLPQRLNGHKAAIWSVVFSSDGNMLISGDRDGMIRLWNPVEGVELRSLACSGPGEPRVTSVAVSPDGTTLVSVGFDAAVRVWDVMSGNLRRVMRGHCDVVRSVAFSPDGHRVVTASDDGTLRQWRIDDQPMTEIIRAHENEVTSIAISPDTSILATVSGALEKSGQLKLSGLPRIEKQRTLQDGELRLMGVAFSPDGSLLASAGGDWNSAGRVDIWDVKSGQQQRTHWLIDGVTPEEEQEQLQSIWRAATCVSFSRDGRFVAAGGGIWGMESRPGFARVWDVATGQTKAILRGHTQIVRTLAFSPTEDCLAIGGYDAVVRFWDTNSWQERDSINIEPAQAILAIAYSYDGSMLAVAVSTPDVNKPSRVIVFSTSTRKEVTTLRGHMGLLRAVAFSPDGRRLATTAYDHTARIWDPFTGQELAKFSLTHGGASAMFAPNGRYLAVGAKDGMVRIWDIGAADNRFTPSNQLGCNSPSARE